MPLLVEKLLALSRRVGCFEFDNKAVEPGNLELSNSGLAEMTGNEMLSALFYVQHRIGPRPDKTK